MNREELAWAAGFFDGEGCIGVFARGGDKKPCIRIKVGQIDRRPLDRLKGAVGVGSVYGPYAKKQPQWNATHDYHVASFEKCQAFVALLWTWLSEPKREQAKTALLEELAINKREWIRKKVAV